MSKLTVMQGLPASGKSSKAAELIKADGNAIRVNKDQLREMLFPGLPWTYKREDVVVEMQTKMVKHALSMNKNVVVDDTNFAQRHLDRWKRIALLDCHKYEVVFVDTPVHECIKRDALREGKAQVGKDVILNMAHRYGIVKQEKPFVIYDLDGTLADITVRRENALKANGELDWGKFFDPAMVKTDVVREDIREMLWEDEDHGNEIVILSGRSDATREATENWLAGANIYYSRLIMRPATDFRKDTDLKKWFLHNYLDKSRCTKVVDDRPCVIRMWEEEGMNLVDVGNGVEF